MKTLTVEFRAKVFSRGDEVNDMITELDELNSKKKRENIEVLRE